MISQSLKTPLERVEALNVHVREEARAIRQALDDASKDWPDHQIIPAQWYRRGEAVPPVGKLWYSDGTRVWLVYSDGKGMGGSPDICRYWTHAWIPAPPIGRELELTAEPELPMLEIASQ